MTSVHAKPEQAQKFAGIFERMESAGRGDRFDLACRHCAHLLAEDERLRGEARQAIEALNEGRLVDVVRILSALSDP